MESTKEKPDYREQPGEGETKPQPKSNTNTPLLPAFNDSNLGLNNPETFKTYFDELEKNLNETDNHFPVSAFPLAIQEIILATNKYLKFPTDFMGASMLFAASVAIGNTHKVKVKNSWNEGTTIYITLVGRPGSNKTPPLKFTLNPIFNKDQESHAKYKKQKSEYEKAIKQDQEAPEKPIYRKHLVSDFTLEALIELHSYNLRGLGVYSDEIQKWIKDFNRYNSGSAVESWLSNFSGTPIDSIRVGKKDEPILIKYPCISVCGGIQPGILKELQKDNKGENGFIDRLLFAFPNNIQKEVWSEEELPQIFIDRWHNVINNLLSMPLMMSKEGEIKPKILEFNTFAWDALKDWQAMNTREINETINDSLAGVYSKLEMYVIRFSLILELLKIATENQNEPDYSTLNDADKINWLYRKAAKLCHPDKNNFKDADEIMKQLNNAKDTCDLAEIERIHHTLNKPKVGLESVLAAIKLVNYFKKTAQKVNSILNNTPIEALNERKKAFYQLLPKFFKTDDAVKIGEKIDYPERTIKDFLNDRDYFHKLDHGKYQKLF